MPTLGTPKPASTKMEARKEIRMHREDAARIRDAAAATGVQEADFIRQAALQRAQEVERRMAVSILSPDAYDAFAAAVDAPPVRNEKLGHRLQQARSMIKDG